ncbi:MAG: tyrosine-type recombinase/integrase [Candidatus Reddybacter sp.]
MAQSKLTALKVESLSIPGRYSDSGGLYLNISKEGTKSWLYRYQRQGSRRWMGLGSYHKKSNTLATARAMAVEMKGLLNKGLDPIDNKRGLQEAKIKDREESDREKRLRSMTFKACAEGYMKIMAPEWSNPKHRQQWANTLATYAYPFIGDMPVNGIGTEHIRQCLDPIWNTKTETASRVRQRIESVISYAIVNKYREQANPAVWKGSLDKLYPKPSKVKDNLYHAAGQEQHHNALSYPEIPAFITRLKAMGGVAPIALKFLILTASRTGEVRFAQWDEFDLNKKEWNIPKARMKARKAHRVALSDTAVELIEAMPRVSEWVFPGGKIGKPMSDGALSAVLKRMDMKDITVHGFRSSFRDYIGEETGFPHRLAEYALAHGLSDETEKAYARGDLLKRRFELMAHWASYVDSNATQTSSCCDSQRN